MLRSVILSAAIIAGSAITCRAADLFIVVEGANPATGQILLSVFDRPVVWMSHPVAAQSLPVRPDGTGTATFTLDVGTYAVALIHDANGNGKMDTNAIAIPTEAFGFSNHARAHFGPPAFRKAAFDLPGQGAHLTISLDRTDR